MYIGNSGGVKPTCFYSSINSYVCHLEGRLSYTLIIVVNTHKPFSVTIYITSSVVAMSLNSCTAMYKIPMCANYECFINALSSILLFFNPISLVESALWL